MKTSLSLFYFISLIISIGLFCKHLEKKNSPTASFVSSQYDNIQFSENQNFNKKESIQEVYKAKTQNVGYASPLGNLNEELRKENIPVFSFDIAEGTIGSVRKGENDLSYDNVFITKISDLPQTYSQWTLEMEVSNSKIPFSWCINGHQYQHEPHLTNDKKGAKLIKKNISQEVLKKGLNSILFTIDENHSQFITVKNLKLYPEIHPSKDLYEERIPLQKLNYNVRQDVRHIELYSADLSLKGANKDLNQISIFELSPDQIAVTSTEITNTTPGKKAFRVLPFQTFSEPVTVKIAYDPTLIPKGFPESDLRAFYFDRFKKEWVALPKDSIDTVTHHIYAKTQNGEDFISGILKLPESPETAGYMPTTMGEIKAADPNTGITSVSIPIANNQGSASTNFPLKLPHGRNGMTPSLQISYSSQGGNSWLGLGWNIELPSINIDTRFGAPRYDASLETETYTFQGMELTPIAHRNENFEPRESNKRFYPIKESGNYSKITRLGNHPNNYYWKIENKNGSISYYGGDENGIIENAVLRDAQGNIGQWALTKEEDSYTNNILYTYFKDDEGGLGAQNGQYLYPFKINYTGHQGSEGNYSVHFLTETGRPDVNISARLGYKEVLARRLSEIQIAYKGERIRSYELDYENGAFNKTLLKTITEKDKEGNVFYANTFEYFDEVRDENGNYEIFGEEVVFNTPSDNLDEQFGFMGDFAGTYSVINGTRSNAKSMNFRIGVGFPWELTKFKVNTIGYHGGSSNGDSRTQITLRDIDGDNLPDKVVKDANDNIFYRKNLLATGQYGFGEARPLNGLVSLGRTKTNNANSGIDATFGFSVGIASVNIGYGYDRQWSNTKTDEYFLDKNGDGLEDFVKNRRVYFNSIDEQGNPTFSLGSELTPVPILSNNSISTEIFTPPTQQFIDSLKMTFPQNDMVRVWKAPRTGNISLNSVVRLLESEDPNREFYLTNSGEDRADGVITEIYQDGEAIWSHNFGATDYNQDVVFTSNFDIEEGEYLFFRVHSKFDGNYDLVQWNPIIEYQNNLLEIDHNGLNPNIYNPSTDFVRSFRSPLVIAENTPATVSFTLTKPELTDHLYIRVVGVAPGLEQYQDLMTPVQLNANDIIANQAYSFDVTINDLENIMLILDCNSIVNWKDVKLRDTQVEYANQQMFIPYKLRFYPQYLSQTNYQQLPPFPSSKLLLTYPDDDLSDNTASGRVALVAKQNESIISKTIFTYTEGDFELNSQESFQASNAQDEIFLEAIAIPYTENFIGVFANELDSLEAFYLSPSDSILLHEKLKIKNVHYQEYSNLGYFYRGWGSFGLNGKLTPPSNPIDISQLDQFFNANYTQPPNPDFVPQPDQVSGYEIYTQPFFKSDFKENGISGQIEWNEVVDGSLELDTFIDEAIMQSSRLGENDILQYYELPAIGAGATALDLKSTSKSQSRSGEASASLGPISAGGAASKSENSKTYSLTQMQDLNGDRFPDFISESSAQITTPTGDLSSQIINMLSNEPSLDRSESWGVTGTGGFNHGYPLDRMNTYQRQKTENSKTEEKSVKETIQSQMNVGLSGGVNHNHDFTDFIYVDINSDGLPDKLSKGGNVSLNRGYGFLSQENWGFENIRKGESKGNSININAGIPLSLSLLNGSFSGGLNYTKNTSITKNNFLDINGDGIIDFIDYNDNNMVISLNNGNGFTNFNQPGFYGNNPLKNVSVNRGGTLGFSFEIPLIPIFPVVRLVLSAGFGKSYGAARTENSFADMNGDGFVDFIKSDGENDLKVRFSKIGKTNLLKKISTPLGSTMELVYERTKNTFEDPIMRWELREVEIYDGYSGDGADYAKNRFEYIEPNYDRYERKFLGYAMVKTHQLDTENNDEIYRTAVVEYYNQDKYRLGISYHSYTLDSDNHKYAEIYDYYTYKDYHTGAELQENVFTAMNYNAPIFIGVSEKVSNFYEGQPNIQISQRQSYTYDNRGNIIEYKDYGTGAENDLVRAEITYFSQNSPYITTPSQIEVYTEEGLKRKKTAQINPQTGAVQNISQYLENGDAATYDFEYDAYGNLTKNTGPENYKEQRFYNAITYDGEEHMFPIKLENAFEYTSSTQYDYLFQTPISTTDMNDETIRYELDNKGRTIKIQGPIEIEEGIDYTLKFEYHPLASTPYAKTYHYNPDFPDSDILTYTFTDGLGKAIQVKKTISEFVGPDQEDDLKLQVSGKVIYDAFGRAIETYYPITEALSQGPTFNSGQSDITPITTTYDVLDRTMQTVFPDGTSIQQNYGVETYAGLPTIMVEAIDPMGLKTKTYTDAKGRTLAIKQISANEGTILTQYFYNALGELLKVKDTEGVETHSFYDLLGRRTKMIHPDYGEMRFNYDLASNVLKKSTPQMREELEEDAGIVYEYDYNRLEQILYPKNVQNNVHYYYGDKDADHKRVGRLWLQEDASGAREFFYGMLGTMKKEIRTVAVNSSTILTYVSELEYDTWNKIQSLSYPDGEKVTYTYNKAGKLRSMSGEKEGVEYSYIQQTGYDLYEQKVYCKQGNESETYYNYDPTMQRLENLTVDTPTRQIMNNSYSYDAVSNITKIINSATAPNGMGLLGGSVLHEYEYDDFYRLIKAEGEYIGNEKNAEYVLDMEYDLSNKIQSKRLLHAIDNESVPESTYHLAYNYEGEGPTHAVKSIVQSDLIDPSINSTINFDYDANGNLSYRSQGNDFMEMRWDEDNRLMGVNQNGKVSMYTYDASGERVIKSNGSNQSLFIDGAPVASIQHEEDYTAYVSPYIVVQKGKFTKHYFVGSHRVTSKIGTGHFENNTALENGITAGNIDFKEREAIRQRWINDWLASLGIPPGAPNAQGGYADGAYPQIPMPDNDNDEPPLGWPRAGVINEPGDVPGPPAHFGPEQTSDNIGAGYGFITSTQAEDNRYYYHPNHLGSTSYITNADGEVCQHVEYIPFGESLIEEHLNSEVSPYLFNGKERDAETGLYYYGARYYDPKISLWLSVDPLVEKTMDAYGYCANNPVKFIDPDGNNPELNYLTQTVKIGDKPRKYTFAEGSILHRYLNPGKIPAQPTNYSSDMDLQRVYTEIDKNLKTIKDEAGKNNYKVGTDGRCAQYVRQFFLKIPHGIGHAYQIFRNETLENYGYSKISPRIEDYIPQKGDIIVMDGKDQDGSNEPSDYGHIAVFDGEYWVSDYIQKEGYRPGTFEIQILKEGNTENFLNSDNPKFSIWRRIELINLK